MSWAPRFIRNFLLCTLPVAVCWCGLGPVYSRFLLKVSERAVHVLESPDVTALPRLGSDRAYVQRLDFPPSRSLVRQFRVADLHFHWILLGSLFLGVPGVGWRRRAENLGWATVWTILFDIILLVVFVQSTYATQLGPWSVEHYGPWTRELLGLAGQFFELPLKLGLPLILWAGCYLDEAADANGVRLCSRSR